MNNAIKTILKRSVSILMVLLFAYPALSQTLHSSYFIESMPIRHKLNPALSGDYGYVSFPGLGGISVNGTGNVGISNFLFPNSNGELMNFLDPAVNSAEFLDNIKDINKVYAGVDMTILSAGFFAFKGFNTIDLSLRTMSKVRVPKDIFAFLKIGRTGQSGATHYNMDNIRVDAMSYLDLSFGHSRKINEKWEVGAKVKLLMGLGRVDMNISELNLLMDKDKWEIQSHGTGNVALPEAEFHKTTATDAKGNIREVIDGFDVNGYKFKIVGGGLGLDIGAVYRPLKQLSISAAVTDIGFISWTKNMSAQTINDTFIYDAYEDGGSESADFGNDMSALLQFEEVDKPKLVTTLQASLNLGVEYSFLNDIISVGILSNTNFGTITYAEGMLVANIRAKKAFMMSLNGKISNFGNSFGALLNVCPKGFNFFVGLDCYPGLKFTPKYYIPTNKFNINVSLGMNFTFGAKTPYEKQ